MKTYIIISWILIALSTLGFLIIIADNEVDGDIIIGIAIFAFYAAFTYKVQQYKIEDK